MLSDVLCLDGESSTQALCICLTESVVFRPYSNSYKLNEIVNVCLHFSEGKTETY